MKLNDTTPNWTALNREQKGAVIRPLIQDELLTYAQIAERLGVTRLAIAGAADRNDIKTPLARDSTGERGSRGGTVYALRNALKPKKVKQPKPERPKMSRIAPTQPAGFPDDFLDRTPLRKDAWLALPGSTPRQLHALEQHDCKWPINAEPPFTFCGQPAAAGRVYCSAHAALAYKPRPEIKKGTTA